MLDLPGPFSAPMMRIGIRERNRPKGIRVRAGQAPPPDSVLPQAVPGELGSRLRGAIIGPGLPHRQDRVST